MTGRFATQTQARNADFPIRIADFLIGRTLVVQPLPELQRLAEWEWDSAIQQNADFLIGRTWWSNRSQNSGASQNGILRYSRTEFCVTLGWCWQRHASQILRLEN
jgi:hypothetical protein